jgi:hypothetical protein
MPIFKRLSRFYTILGGGLKTSKTRVKNKTKIRQK